MNMVKVVNKQLSNFALNFCYRELIERRLDYIIYHSEYITVSLNNKIISLERKCELISFREKLRAHADFSLMRDTPKKSNIGMDVMGIVMMQMVMVGLTMLVMKKMTNQTLMMTIMKKMITKLAMVMNKAKIMLIVIMQTPVMIQTIIIITIMIIMTMLMVNMTMKMIQTIITMRILVMKMVIQEMDQNNQTHLHYADIYLGYKPLLSWEMDSSMHFQVTVLSQFFSFF